MLSLQIPPADHFQITNFNRESPSYLMAATPPGAGRRTLWLSGLREVKAGVTAADHRPAHPQLPAYPTVIKLPRSSVDNHSPSTSSSPSPAQMRPSSPFRKGRVLSCACEPPPKAHPTSPQTAALPAAQLQLAPIVNQFSLPGGLCITSNLLLPTPPYTDPCPHPTPSLFSVSW